MSFQYHEMMIKAIITDFDGTLVDTFESNFLAYQKAFTEFGYSLSSSQYRACYGLRYDSFMQFMKIEDPHIANRIKEAKKYYYPQYFNRFRPNHALIKLIETCHVLGLKTAIASTARKENLMNAIDFLGIEDYFDLVYSGIDVKLGKPSPEIYIKAMNALGVSPNETLIFEDSEVGIAAAKASGANYMIVPTSQFNL